ncbi:gluconokinase [Clostridium sp. SYSU_GA19001]|uniref:gluconokinase n=1 Tax=Clostridium caldaquaticum TaxID=2940653 RepID=UPI0020770672|nr:gluconokinase [Clostridium caldaquaticum]MCM8712010.1 gluconokinase [Clostridium caldaquaticum]
MKQYYLGIDIGTTSTKAIVFDKEGRIVSKSVVEYPIYSPKQNHREQNPDEILKAVINTLEDSIKKAGINGEDLKFIAFSSMMHSIIAVDSDGNPLTPCIIWNDNRSVPYVDKFKRNGKGREIYLRTGTPTHPMSPLYKLMWLKDNKPEIYNKAYKFVSIKEYIFYKFFKEYIVDYSVASATGMFNIFDLQWDNDVLKLLELDESKLSKPVSTTYIINGLDDDICKKTGLSKQSRFVVGASDGCLANLGSNAITSGAAVATIGTSGAVRVVFDKPVTDKKERVFCYYLYNNKYVVGGAINNGGVVYRWFRDEFSEAEKEQAKKLNIDPYVLLNEKIKNTEPGSNGLLFLPFLTGERAPYWNANLRGAYIGISDGHSRNHFARALMEGICYDMNDVFNAIKDLVGEVKCIYANGGFTRSQEWLQILCDIFDINVVVSENYESSCIGAVMLGMLAVGEVEKLEQCSYLVKENRMFKPNEETTQVYKNLYDLYKQSIESLTIILEKISNFQNNQNKRNEEI